MAAGTVWPLGRRGGSLTISGGVHNEGTINLNAGSTFTVNGIGGIGNYGTINNNGGSLNLAGTITGTGVVNQNSGSMSPADGAAFDTQDVKITGGTVTATGTPMVGKTTGNPGILNVSGGTTTITGTLGVGNAGTSTSGGGSGTLNVSGGTINATLLNLAGPGSTVTVGASGPHKVLKVNTLTIAGSSDDWTAQVDLTSNDLIIQSTSGGAAAAYADAYNQVKTAFYGNGGLWTGAGITSSKAAAAEVDNNNNNDLLYAVGIISNSDTPLGGDPNNPMPIYPTFSGQSADASATLIKSTYFGDADLSGAVDGTDYFLIDQGFGQVNGGWLNGDFDYNGTTDGTDYFLIDNNFGNGPLTPALSGVSVVPEPAAMGMMAWAAGLLLRRCRRR